MNIAQCVSNIVVLAGALLTYGFTDIVPNDEVMQAYRLMHTQNAQTKELAAAGSWSTYKVVTYNIGLMNMVFNKVPEYTKRSNLLDSFLEQELLGHNPDIVFIQELWYEKDAETVISFANRNGYLTALDTPEGWKSGWRGRIDFSTSHGTQILVKSDLVAEGHKASYEPYSLRPALEEMVGAGRGILQWKLTLTNGQVILLANTHLSPYPYVNKDTLRIDQAKQLIETILENEDVDYYLLGGDFNSGPELGNIEGDQADWLEDYRPYFNLYQLSRGAGMLDAFRAVHTYDEHIGYTQDRRINPLTFYSKGCAREPEQRLDQIWIGHGRSRNSNDFFVGSAKLIFDKPFGNEVQDGSPMPNSINLEGRNFYDTSPDVRSQSTAFAPLFFSDHVGVFAEVRIRN